MRSQPASPPTLPGRTRAPAIVDPVNFLLATRDTGYRSTAQSIAEFIDNSFQAEAHVCRLPYGKTRNRSGH